MNKKTFGQFTVNLVCKNLCYKLGALFLTVLLYVTVSQKVSKKEVQSFSDIPVGIEVPDEFVMDRSEPYLVKVSLSGDKQLLDDLDVQGVKIQTAVKSEKIVPGRKFKLKLRANEVMNLPPGVKVQSIAPDVLEFDLFDITRKQVPVVVRYDSLEKLPKDFKIVKTSFTPSEVELQGSAKQLQNIKEIYASHIPIDEQAIHSFDHKCTLNIPVGLRSNHTSVLAQVEINKVFTEHNFSAVPLLIIQSAERTRKFQVTKLDPETVYVVMRGPKSLLDRMLAREISASINLDTIDKPGTYDLPVSVTVRHDSKEVTVKNFYPLTARVIVVQE